MINIQIRCDDDSGTDADCWNEGEEGFSVKTSKDALCHISESRKYLKSRGWKISRKEDVCPACLQKRMRKL